MKRKPHIWQNIICLLLLISMVFCLGACKNKGSNGDPESAPVLAATAIEHETKFGAVYCTSKSQLKISML